MLIIRFKTFLGLRRSSNSSTIVGSSPFAYCDLMSNKDKTFLNIGAETIARGIENMIANRGLSLESADQSDLDWINESFAEFNKLASDKVMDIVVGLEEYKNYPPKEGDPEPVRAIDVLTTCASPVMQGRGFCGCSDEAKMIQMLQTRLSHIGLIWNTMDGGLRMVTTEGAHFDESGEKVHDMYAAMLDYHCNIIFVHKELIRRHGPMLRNVEREYLNTHDDVKIIQVGF